MFNLTYISLPHCLSQPSKSIGKNKHKTVSQNASTTSLLSTNYAQEQTDRERERESNE